MDATMAGGTGGTVITSLEAMGATGRTLTGTESDGAVMLIEGGMTTSMAGCTGEADAGGATLGAAATGLADAAGDTSRGGVMGCGG